MKLFLSSAGIKPETKKDFLELLGKDPRSSTVAFIPTACDPKPDKSYVQWTIDQITNLGMNFYTVDLKGENETSLIEKLSRADVICVNGGDTAYLLDWVLKSGFNKVIKILLNQGIVYFGVSAGSCIACPTIEMSKWKSPNENTNSMYQHSSLSALGLVDFLITVHYENKWKEAIEKSIKTTDLPVVALTDQQAIIKENESIKLAGPKEVLKFNGFEFR